MQPGKVMVHSRKETCRNYSRFITEEITGLGLSATQCFCLFRDNYSCFPPFPSVLLNKSSNTLC